MHYLKMIICALITLLVMPLFASASKDNNDKIYKGVLENGLTYYLIKNNSKTIDYSMLQKTGGSVEEAEQKGLAHFVEHVTLQCSMDNMSTTCEEYFDKNKLKNIASTYKYKILYGITEIEKEDKELNEKALTILHSWIAGLHFKADEIDKVRKVIVQEKRTGRPINPFMVHMSDLLYSGSQYAGVDNLGSMAVVKSIDIPKIKEFYTKWFNPNTIAISIEGDIDIEKYKAIVKERFGDIKTAANASKFTPFKSEKNEEVVFEGYKNERGRYSNISIMNRIEERIVKNKADFIKSEIYANLFKTFLNNRLMSNIQLAGGSSSMVQANIEYKTLPVGYRQLVIALVAAPNKEYQGLKNIMSAYYDMVQYGLTASEIKDYTQHFAANWKTTQEAFDYAQVLEYNFIWGQPLYSYNDYISTYNTITKNFNNNDFIKYCREYLKLDNTVIIATAGAQAPMFNKEKVLSIINDKTNNCFEKKEQIAAKFNSSILNKSAKIVSSKKINAKITEYTLSNGLKVVHNNVKSAMVNLFAISPGGYSTLKEKDVPAAELATLYPIVFGYGNNSLEEIDKFKYLHGIRFQGNINEIDEQIQGESPVSNFEKLLQLTIMYVKQPGTGTLDMQSQRSLTNGVMGRRKSANRDAEFRDEVFMAERQIDSPQSPSYFRNITGEKVKNIFSAKYNNANDWLYYITGSINNEKFKSLITKYLGSIDKGGKKEKFKDYNPLDFDDKEYVINHKIPARAMSGGTDTYYALFQSLSYKESLALKLLEKLLKSRSETELRIKRSGLYNVHYKSIYNSLPTSYARIDINFGTARQNIIPYLDYIDSQFKDLSENQVSAFELKAIRRTLNAEKVTNDKRFANILDSFMANKEYSVDELKISLDDISADDIQKLAKRFYENKQVLKVIFK